VRCEDDALNVTATAGSGKGKITVILEAEHPNLDGSAAAIAHALGVDAGAVLQDLTEIPGLIESHPAPTTTPAPTNPASLADFATWANQRLGERAGRAVKATVTGAIRDWLLAKDRLLRDATTERPYMLADDRRALPLDDEGLTLKATLAAVGMNPTEPAFAWLLADLQVTAYRDGLAVALARWAKVTPDGALCVSCGPKGYVRATAGGPLEYCPNGADEIVFAGDASLPPWDYTAVPVNPLDVLAFTPAIVAPAEVPDYDPETQKRLLTVWLCGLVANSRPLPILAALGDKGGGKSTLGRAILRTLLGEGADLTPATGDERDFWALATGRPVIGLDNVDAAPAPWLADALAVTATGGRKQGREYYTTRGISDAVLQAAVVVTSRTAVFARPDVAERILPITTGELTDEARRADSALSRDLATDRDGILVYLTTNAINVLSWLPRAPRGLPARFLDFGQFVWSWHAATGQEAKAIPTLEAWRAAQALAIGEADPLLMAILEFAPSKGLYRFAAAAMVRELTKLGAELPQLGGGKIIARRLRELKASLWLGGWVLEDEKSGEQVLFTLRRK
jgi:hypothetical protein